MNIHMSFPRLYLKPAALFEWLSGSYDKQLLTITFTFILLLCYLTLFIISSSLRIRASPYGIQGQQNQFTGMNIDNENFVRRKILGNQSTKEYSPKKRWDEGSFGNQKRLLEQHVENAFKNHLNDADILQKFRKQAEQFKMRIRRQKFPHLYAKQAHSIIFQPYIQKNIPKQLSSHSKQPVSTLPYPYQQEQQIHQRSRPIPQNNSKETSPRHSDQYYGFEPQTRLQYERAIAQRDLQLFKGSQKIKKQKKQIQTLNNRLKQIQKQDELDKYVRSQEQMDKLNKVIMDMKQQLSSRRSLLQRSRLKQLPLETSSFNREKKNKSQVFLNNHNKASTILYENEQDKRQDSFQKLRSPLVLYSLPMRKNNFIPFEIAPLRNHLKPNQPVAQHLEQLRIYHKRLQHLKSQNRLKLNQNKW